MIRSIFDMYFGASFEIIERAKELRKNQTKSEKILWEKLRNNRIHNLNFRRQHPIERFIVDFYCHKIRLVIELDGEIHNYQKGYDEGRNAEMEKYGIKIIRFKNEEVENNIELVVSKIENISMELKSRST